MSYKFKNAFHAQPKVVVSELRQKDDAFDVTRMECYFNTDIHGAENLLEALPIGTFLLGPSDGSDEHVCILSIKIKHDHIIHAGLDAHCVSSLENLDDTVQRIDSLLKEEDPSLSDITLIPISYVLRPAGKYSF